MKLLTLLLLSIPLFSQPNVAYKVFNNVTIASSSTFLRNQGQTNHIVNFTYTNTGGTCSQVLGYIQLESSFDQDPDVPDTGHWTPITLAPARITPITGGFQGTMFATGLYPFLRLRITAAPLTHCKVNAWYSGSAYSVVYNQLLNALSGGNYLAQSTAITTTTGSTITLLDTSLDLTKRYVIYGAILSNLSASNSFQVTFTEQAPGCGGSALGTYQTLNLAANQTVVLPTNVVPWFIGGSAGTSFCGQFSGTTPNFGIQVNYRLEQ